jgi:hypothetical protein
MTTMMEDEYRRACRVPTASANASGTSTCTSATPRGGPTANRAGEKRPLVIIFSFPRQKPHQPIEIAERIPLRAIV